MTNDIPNDLIECIHKEFRYAKNKQKGVKTHYLNNIGNIRKLCSTIKDRTQLLAKICLFSNIDTQVRCIPHGINGKKSIKMALDDINSKLKKMEQKQFNQNRVNWSEGEIAMLNAVVDIANTHLLQNKIYDMRVPYILIKRYFESTQKPEYVYARGFATDIFVQGDQYYEKLEKIRDQFKVW